MTSVNPPLTPQIPSNTRLMYVHALATDDNHIKSMSNILNHAVSIAGH